MSGVLGTALLLTGIAAGGAALALNVRNTAGRRSKTPFSLALLVGVFLAVVMAAASPPYPGVVLPSLGKVLLAFLLPQIFLGLRDRRRRRRRSDRRPTTSSAASAGRRPGPRGGR